MITRRVLAFSLVATFAPGAALAQTRWLTPQGRQAILDTQAIARIEAARYAEFEPYFTRLAARHATDDAVLSGKLRRVATGLTAASVALTNGANAIPALPVAPTLSPEVLRGPALLPPGALRSGPVAPAPSATTAAPPAPVAPPANLRRGAPPLARPPIVVAPVASGVTTERIDLTPVTLALEMQGNAGEWSRVGRDLRDTAAATGIALISAAQNFESASRYLDQVRQAMDDAGLLGGRGDDRLSNFEIQDLMSAFNQSNTLASSTLKELSDTRMDTIRRIGG